MFVERQIDSLFILIEKIYPTNLNNLDSVWGRNEFMNAKGHFIANINGED